jgi:hypothetical protein
MMSPSQLASELEARLNGPHAVEHTTGAADLVSEGIRYLNYATGSHAGDALEYPAAIYRVLGTLSEAAYRLPQLFHQMTRWLEQQDDAGMLAMDDGTSPTVAVAAAELHLEEAGRLARRLGKELAGAQNQISRLNGRGPARPDDEEDGAL